MYKKNDKLVGSKESKRQVNETSKTNFNYSISDFYLRSVYKACGGSLYGFIRLIIHQISSSDS